jgi:hypothetical protein
MHGGVAGTGTCAGRGPRTTGIAGRGRRLGRAGCAGEFPDALGEPGWLVQGDERVAVCHLGQLPAREELGEAPAMIGWHHAVVAGPDDEGGVNQAGRCTPSCWPTYWRSCVRSFVVAGQVAGAGSASARAELAGGLERSWAGAPDSRCLCAGLAEYLEVCELRGVDPVLAGRADVAGYVRYLFERPSHRDVNVVAIDSGAGLANATIQQRLVAVTDHAWPDAPARRLRTRLGELRGTLAPNIDPQPRPSPPRVQLHGKARQMAGRPAPGDHRARSMNPADLRRVDRGGSIPHHARHAPRDQGADRTEAPDHRRRRVGQAVVGINLEPGDLPEHRGGAPYPIELSRAVTMTWLWRPAQRRDRPPPSRLRPLATQRPADRR